MAQNVLIAGALFPNVPSISVPDQSNNWHSYVDTSDANATAGDILAGKTAYVNGAKLTGTGQGGGGTPVSFSVQDQGHLYYVDADGVFKDGDTFMGITDTTQEGAIVVLLQGGATTPTVTGLTQQALVSLGTRANYRFALFFTAGV